VSRSVSPALVLRLYWRAMCARACRPLPSLKGGRDENGRQGRACRTCGETGTRPASQRRAPPNAIRSGRAVDMRLDQRSRPLFQANLLRFPAFWANSRTKADARDWREKTEDWQVETGRGRPILLSGDNTFIEQAVWLCRAEAEVAL
jgi:hypothetical protein